MFSVPAVKLLGYCRMPLRGKRLICILGHPPCHHGSQSPTPRVSWIVLFFQSTKTQARRKLENRQVDDQLDHPALRLIAARPDLFARQGNVAATWRCRDGKRFGPYYRLSYRVDGRQCASLSRPGGALVERVRQALGAQQQAITQYRLFDRLVRQVRASLRIEKIRLRSLLCPFGLRLKGWEVRGWRISPLRWLLPSRRRLFPAVAIRARRMRRRPPNDPVARLHRFLEARDGYVLDGDVGRALETPHLRR